MVNTSKDKDENNSYEYNDFDSNIDKKNSNSLKEKKNNNEINNEQQIDFIRRFYNKILMKNLKDYFPANEIDKIIAEEGWVKDKEYIIPNERNASPEFNVAKEIEDIKYINDMNVQFNKLIKEHEHLVTFLNSQPSAK